jgi:spore germination protein GerM
VRRAVVVLLAAALAGAGASACGVRLQDAPVPVPADQRPALTTGAAVPPQPADAVVYLVDDGRLVPQDVPAASDDVEGALRALLAASRPQGQRRSAVPPGTQLLSVQRDGDLVVVDLDERFAQVRGRDQVLAAAQVVLTATERPPARRVVIRVVGEVVAVPVEDGTAVDRPVTRSDFERLLTD